MLKFTKLPFSRDKLIPTKSQFPNKKIREFSISSSLFLAIYLPYTRTRKLKPFEKRHSASTVIVVYRVSKSTWIIISITIVLFPFLRFPHALAEAGFGALLLSLQAPACIQGRGIGPDRSDLAAHSNLVTAIRRDYRWNRFSLLDQEGEREGEGGGDGRKRMRNKWKEGWWSFLEMSSRKNRPRRAGTGGGIRLSRDRAGCFGAALLWTRSTMTQFWQRTIVLLTDNRI